MVLVSLKFSWFRETDSLTSLRELWLGTSLRGDLFFNTELPSITAWQLETITIEPAAEGGCGEGEGVVH